MRLIGTTLIYPTVTYSPWFPRSGDAATFVLEMLTTTISNDTDFVVEVETKNSEDDDGSPTSIAFPAITVPSNPTDVFRVLKRVDELLELVRFKFSWGVSPDPTPSAGTFVFFRVLPPMWEFN